jgi:hypothetical protein
MRLSAEQHITYLGQPTSDGKVNDVFDVVLTKFECLLPLSDWNPSRDQAAQPRRIRFVQRLCGTFVVAPIRVDGTEDQVVFQYHWCD